MKILIVDDVEISSQCISDMLIFIFDKVDITCCVSYRMALLHLDKQYDLVLCDHFLGDGYGSDFVDQYSKRWPSCKVIRYSGNKDEANLQGDTKCYDISTLQNELFMLKRTVCNTNKISEPYININELRDVSKNVDKQYNFEIESKGINMKTYLPIVGVVISIIGFGIAYGQLIQNVTNTETAFNKHVIQQDITYKETSSTLEYLKIQNALIVDQNNRSQKDIEEIKKIVMSINRR